MGYEEIVALIGSLGFPIVACIVMWKQNGCLQNTLHDISNTLVMMNERISNLERKE